MSLRYRIKYLIFFQDN